MTQNEKKKELYIPLNVIESQDLISGIGRKEVSYIGAALLIGVILAVIIFSSSGNMVAAVMTAGILVSITVLMVRRDQFNESMVDKLRFIKIYMESQKRYEYRYFNIYGGDVLDDSE